MTPPVSSSSVFWFRRDLRIDDNHGLAECLRFGGDLFPIFIFDTDILDQLEPDDHRVTYIHQAVTELDKDLRAYGSRLHVFHGRPLDIFKKLFKERKIRAVFANEDYEPAAVVRDKRIAELAIAHGAEFRTYKDQVIFAKSEIAKDDGSPYKVFTPYARRWRAHFESHRIASHPSEKLLERAGHARAIAEAGDIPALKELGFKPARIPVPELKLQPALLKDYAEKRDFMARDATTKIGTYLRFGTYSVRAAVRLAEKYSAVWLNELIWREFFQSILHHFPKTVERPFDERFEKFPWRKSENDFAAWCEGRTGYPIVDAGMREINATGFMHNRARMITGSFLTKHLLLDWRKGERYFAKMLFDFELASNVGNWQWVAGCGVDAAPYFRIFNPALQTKRFDAAHAYIKRWVPEYGTAKYPKPIVDHEFARRRALIAYDKIKTGSKTS